MHIPKLAQDVKILPGAHITGNVTVGEGSSVWYNAVLRGDVGRICIGARTNIQDNCVLHTDTGVELLLGDDVTVGHLCILHGCRVGNGSVIGMGSILLDGAQIGQNCLVGAGSLVTRNACFPDGVLLFGRPAKVIRPLTETELQHNRQNAAEYVRLATEWHGK